MLTSTPTEPSAAATSPGYANMDSPAGITVMPSIEDETGARPSSTQGPARKLAPREISGDGKIYANINAVLLEASSKSENRDTFKLT